MTATGLSDNGKYPAFCYTAARQDEVFRNFKRDPIYNQILEHLTPEQGAQYLDVILNDYDIELTDAQWELILLNDSLGNPRTAEYEFGDKILNCAPTTLRYTKVLLDLATLFDFNEIQTVAEVGIGYGGQCRLAMNLLPIARYELIDLPEVLLLAERFLTALDTAGDIRYRDGTHLYNDVPCDLVVSNYAFAELTTAVQNFYFDKIVRHSKAGYMTWNSEMFTRHGIAVGYSAKEFASMIPGAKIIPEIPLTAPGNCIIVWGTRK